MSSPLQKPEIKAIVGTLYLQGGAPREILQVLESDHGLVVTSDTLRQHLVRTGLTQKRKQIDASLNVALAPEKIAITRQEKAQEHLDRWSNLAVSVVEKAMAAAGNAERLRDLSVATNTAAQAVRLFQMTSGAIGSPGHSGPTFNVNFANDPNESPFARAKLEQERARQAAITITVTQVPGIPEQ